MIQIYVGIYVYKLKHYRVICMFVHHVFILVLSSIKTLSTALYILYLLAMVKKSRGWLFLDLYYCTIVQSNIVSRVVVSTIWTHDSLLLQ